jgi:DNA-binding MarR family transcriptional regulator
MTTPADEHAADRASALIVSVGEAAAALRSHSDRHAGAVGQSSARLAVMGVLLEGPLNVPRLARRLALTSPSVQRVVNRLLEDGLIVALPNPDHAVSPLLRLTEPGLAACAAFEASAREDHHRLAQRLDRQDVEAALRVLDALAADR